MRVARRGRCAAALLGLAGAHAAAQGSPTVTVTGPAGNPTRDGTPRFTISAVGFPPSDLPLDLTLQVATRGDFGGTLFADTTLSGLVNATIVVPRLLPEGVSIWWRARARTAQGQLVLSDATGPVQTSPWLTLIQPNNRNGSTVDTRRPTFQWTSVTVRPPVAPWTYQLFITRSIDGAQVPAPGRDPLDTVYTSAIDLESNTPYRWAVVARAGTGDSVRVQSFASFVVLDPTAPVATNLYPPFPSPFPNERVARTCIWFDLARQAEVRLDVLDIRGNLVTSILPGRGLGPVFPPGRYGRVAVGSDTGCDDRLTWDGRDASGRAVPAGVYHIRFRGAGVTVTKAVVWRGR